MVFSSLEQDLHEMKEGKIQELRDNFQQLSDVEDEKYAGMKAEFSKKITDEKTNTILTYQNQTISSAKRDANTILLTAKTAKKEELVEKLLEEYSSQFEHISKQVLTQVVEVLNCKLGDLVITCNAEDEKALAKITSKKQVTSKLGVPQYSFECQFENELVRFNLRDEISSIVEGNVE